MKNTTKVLLWLLIASIMTFAVASCHRETKTNKITVYSSGDQYGFIDKTGKLVIDPQFDDVDRFSEGLAAVEIKENGWGFIDKSGKMVIEPKFDRVHSFSEGLAAVKTKDGWGFIDKSGKMVIKPTFDYSYGFFEGLARVEIGKKTGFIDKTGKIVINPIFNNDNVGDFHEGLACVKIGEKEGFIDKTGKIVIDPIYDVARDFNEGLACVKSGKRYGFIDKTGQILIDFQFERGVGDFKEGLAWIYNGENFGFIDRTGQIVIDPIYDDAFYDFQENLARVKSKGKYGFIDKTGRMIIDSQFDEALDFKEGLALVKTNDNYGFIDKSGNIVIPLTNPDFYIRNVAYGFSEGLNPIYKRIKYGLKKENGDIITDAIYDELEICSNGLVMAKTDHGWGIIDKKGKIVLDCIYDEISYSRGKFYVTLDNKIGVADQNGKLVIKPKYESMEELYQFKQIEKDLSGYCHYIIWRNKEGITMKQGFSLTNSMTFTNAQGDTLVLAGMAQQSTDWYAIKYLYDKDGEVRGFLSLGNCVNPPYYSLDDRFVGNTFDEDYINTYGYDADVYDLVMETYEDKLYYDRFYFERDEEGRIVRVYDPIWHCSISAPFDGHFNYLVQPNAAWSSDIDGGRFDLYFITAPNDPDDRHFRVDTFYYYYYMNPEIY